MAYIPETLVAAIASMTKYNFDSDDDSLEDCVATMNRLIDEARKITVPLYREDVYTPLAFNDPANTRGEDR